MPLYHKNTVLQFGLHKGKTIEQVLHISPDYILWCIRNIEHFKLNPSLLLHAEIAGFAPTEADKRLNALKPSYPVEVPYEDDKELPELEDDYREREPVDYEDDDWEEDYSSAENSWVDVFGPGEEAETAYWNTD